VDRWSGISPQHTKHQMGEHPAERRIAILSDDGCIWSFGRKEEWKPQRSSSLSANTAVHSSQKSTSRATNSACCGGYEPWFHICRSKRICLSLGRRGFNVSRSCKASTLEGQANYVVDCGWGVVLKRWVKVLQLAKVIRECADPCIEVLWRSSPNRRTFESS